MTKEKYVKRIMRKLTCSGKQKKIIQEELNERIDKELLQYATFDDVKKKMGNSTKVASEYNMKFSEEELSTYKKEKRLKNTAIATIIIIGLIVVFYFMFPKSKPISQSDLFDGDALVSKSEEVAELMGEQEFDTILDDYCSEYLLDEMESDDLESAYESLSEDWGNYESMEVTTNLEMDQYGQTYAIVVIDAEYENTEITFTLSYNTDMKLIGLYMK